MDIKDLKKNKNVLAATVLVLVLVVGVGIIAYSGDIGVDVPTANSVAKTTTTSGQVSINILPNPESNTEGGNE